MKPQELKARLKEIQQRVSVLAQQEDVSDEEGSELVELEAEFKKLDKRQKTQGTASAMQSQLEAMPAARAAVQQPDPQASGVPGDPQVPGVPGNLLGPSTAEYLPTGIPRVGPVSYPRPIEGFAGANEAEKQRNAFAVGKWCLAVIYQDQHAAQWLADYGGQYGVVPMAARKVGQGWTGDSVPLQAVMNIGDNTAGGALVPTPLSNAIIVLRDERGVFRRESKVIELPSDAVTVARGTGEVTVYAIGENTGTTAITASDRTFDGIEIVARQWAARTQLMESLVEDAVIDVAQEVAQSMAWGFADKEDEAGFNGDGTSTFHGIHGAAVKVDDGNHTASVYDAATGNDAFENLDDLDFLKLKAKLPRRASRNAKWYISQVGFYEAMQRLADASGGTTADHHTSGGETRGEPIQFKGKPVVITEVLNSTSGTDASTIKLLYGDLRQGSKLGNRRGFTIKVLRERYADLLQIGVIGHARWGINVHELGDTTDAGSLVALKTAA